MGRRGWLAKVPPRSEPRFTTARRRGGTLTPPAAARTGHVHVYGHGHGAAAYRWRAATLEKLLVSELHQAS